MDIVRPKRVADYRIVIFLKTLLRPILIPIVRIQIPYKVFIDQSCHLSGDGPVVYAANHFCFADIPIMGMITPKHSYILMGKQRLAFRDRLYCKLNGIISVDRKNKSDMADAKEAIIDYLNRDQSIVMFPEATWNLTMHQPMLPMRWGIVDIAWKTGARIVPVVLEYDRESMWCSVVFGKSMTFSPEMDKKESILVLRDTMATMRWEFWERKGIFDRFKLDVAKERQEMFYSIEEYPPIEWEYEQSCIFHPYTEPEEAFAHLQHLIPCRENAFLFRGRDKFTML